MGGRREIPGAPELPRGFFYRVRRNSAGPIVEIRREMCVGSIQVTFSYILTEFHRSHLSALTSACKRAYEKFDSRHAEKAAEAKVLFLYRGDYRGEVS